MLSNGAVTGVGPNHRWSAAAFIGLLSVAFSAHAQTISPIGTPRTVPWGKGRKAFVIDPEAGLKLTLRGPAFLLLELRSKRAGKKVIVDIIKAERFRSRNPVKLRAIGGGRRGYRFATLLAMKVPKGKDTYEIRVKGAEMVVIITVRKRFHRQFGIRPFEDTQGRKRSDMGEIGTL